MYTIGLNGGNSPGQPFSNGCKARTGQLRVLRFIQNPIPVQAPTKYETVVNMKTAKVLTVPPGLLVAADEVIE